MVNYKILEKEENRIKLGDSKGVIYYIIQLSSGRIFMLDNFSLFPITITSCSGIRLIDNLLNGEVTSKYQLESMIKKIKNMNVFKGKMRDLRYILSDDEMSYLQEEGVISSRY